MICTANANSSIISKIESIDVSDSGRIAESINNLKDDIRTNIKKFFPDFETIRFQEKWESLYRARNKVAHNGFFVKTEYDLANNHADELIVFLKEQNEKLSKLHFNAEEAVVYQERVMF